MSDIFCASLHMFFSYFLFPYIASVASLVFHSCPRGSHVMSIADCFHFSVAKLCINLYDPMDCSTLGFPVLPSLPEFAQTHVHWVDDTTQPSPALLPPPPFALNLSSIRFFCSESALCIRWPKYWSFSFSISPSSEYSGLISVLNTYFMPDMVPITFYILTLNFHKYTMR